MSLYCDTEMLHIACTEQQNRTKIKFETEQSTSLLFINRDEMRTPPTASVCNNSLRKG